MLLVDFTLQMVQHRGNNLSSDLFEIEVGQLDANIVQKSDPSLKSESNIETGYNF